MRNSSLTVRDLRHRRVMKEEGLSLIETLIAIGIVSVAAMMPLTTMATATRVDAELQRKSVALRSALAKMDSVLTYDFGDDIEDFIQYWQQPQNATFEIAEFAEIDGSDEVTTGTVTIDATDPLRVGIEVVVVWVHEGEPRRIMLPNIVTETTSE